MEHCTLLKKSIKKVEKINTKQVIFLKTYQTLNLDQRSKKPKKGSRKNKISHINDPPSFISNDTDTQAESLQSEDQNPTAAREPQDYINIPEIPIYEPTAEEFRDPIPLIKKLRDEGYDKFGCVKIIAPTEWDPEFSLSLQDRKITTRKQILQDLIKGKVKQKVKIFLN